MFLRLTLFAAALAHIAGGAEGAHALEASRSWRFNKASAAAAALSVRGGGSAAPAARVESAAPAIRGGGAVATSSASSPPLRGVASVVGGVLVHFVLGSLYCFGNFISYMPKDMLYFKGGKQEGPPHALLAIPLTLVVQCLGLPTGAALQKILPAKVVALLGAWTMVTGVFLSSFATDLVSFLFCYAAMFGFGMGVAYTASWVEGWRWFPGRRGLVSGAVLTGFGSSGFIFNAIGTKMINPDGLNAVDGTFPQVIYDNWPKMLRQLATIYYCLTGLGALLINAPPKGYVASGASAGGGKTEVKVRSLTVPEAVSTRQFWTVWACIFASVAGGINVSANYKYLGTAKENLNSDTFLSLVGGLGALANGAGRLFWGSMADVFGFKKPVMALTLIQAILFPLYTSSGASRATFTMATMLVFFCFGGNFSIFPGVMPKLFGPGSAAAIYSVIYTAFGSTALLSFFGAKTVTEKYGTDSVFVGLGLMSLLACLLASTVQPIQQ